MAHLRWQCERDRERDRQDNLLPPSPPSSRGVSPGGEDASRRSSAVLSTPPPMSREAEKPVALGEPVSKTRKLFAKAIRANLFLNKLQQPEPGDSVPAVEANVDVGSLGHFIDGRKLPHEFATSASVVSCSTAATTAKSSPPSPSHSISPSPRHRKQGLEDIDDTAGALTPRVPPLFPSGRRRVQLIGNTLSAQRVAGYRNQQLSERCKMISPRAPGASPRPALDRFGATPMLAPASPRSERAASKEEDQRSLQHNTSVQSSSVQPHPPSQRQPSHQQRRLSLQQQLLQQPQQSQSPPQQRQQQQQQQGSSQFSNLAKGNLLSTSTTTADHLKGTGSNERGQDGSYFSMDFVKGGVRPRIDQHPLMVAIEEGDSDLHQREDYMDSDEAIVAHKFAQSRWNRPRRGPWVPEPDSRQPESDDGTLLQAAARKVLEGPRLGMRTKDKNLVIVQGNKRKFASMIPVVTREWQALVKEMDMDGTGKVSPDTLVPLMFWLGLSRKRGTALGTLQYAFGPGDITVQNLHELCPYVDVQARLVEGLRKVAYRESLDHLCEYMTENSLLNIRTWFYSMKRSPSGHVDIMEVQNLFAREGVTSDRQALFRYLSYMSQKHSVVAPGEKGVQLSKISIEEFTSILCRCTVAWCLNKTLELVTAAEFETAASSLAALANANSSTAMVEPPSTPPGKQGAASSPRSKAHQPTTSHDANSISLSWTQLQRKITVSLMINHRFWGRESRHVLASFKPPRPKHGENLTPEQWRALFERVKAQGMASVQPGPGEADNPNFLADKTRHDDLPDSPLLPLSLSAR